MAGRIRRAFTLIEILVVLAIITMILSLTVPAIMGMLKTTSIIAATDILRSSVSTTRSQAVSSRKGCSVDIRNIRSPDGTIVFTDSVSTSAILTAEDFETYLDDKAEVEFRFGNNWGFFPVSDAWELYTQQTRELWVGRRVDNTTDPYAGNAYAWNVGSRMPKERAIDKELTVIARFRARQVTGQRGEWGFGLLTNFTRNQRSSSGYRFAVRVETTNSGWNTGSRAQLEKIYSPSNPSNENSYVATDGDATDKAVPVRELDDPGREISSTITPGVWYWMKMRMNRSQKVVSLAGKVWVEGSPEPAEWTVGPVNDRWDDSDASLNILDNFGPGGKPLAGGFCGVWSFGAEIAVDDFSVDWRKTWLLPKGIFMQPKKYAPADPYADDFGLAPLDRFEAGSFPLTYRPDGTSASSRSMLLVITNVSSGDRRAILIDRNTGRVEAADDLTAFQ